MRISLLGNQDSTEQLSFYLRENGITLSHEAPYYTVEFRDTENQYVTLDSVDCKLDSKVREQIAKQLDAPVLLDRPGPNKSDRAVVIYLPLAFTDSQREKVEIAVLNSLLQLRDFPVENATEKESAAPTPDKAKPFWKFW
jgi:hypothetical protein